MLLLLGASSSARAQTLDSFNPNVNGIVRTIVVQPDGKIVIGGQFTAVNTVSRIGIARLNADGALDTSFVPPGSGTVLDILIQPDGKLIVGGNFSINVGGQTRNRVARLNADGSLDTTFDAGLAATPGLSVTTISAQSDGKIIIMLKGVVPIDVRRLNTNGTIDTTFSTPSIGNSSANVGALVVQSDDKIVFSGDFTTVNGQPRLNLARLNADGTLDNSFIPAGGNNGDILELQSDGKFLVRFGLPARRINTDGSLDTSFSSPSPNSGPSAILPLPNGKILIGGSFTTINGQPRAGLAQLNADGTLDTSFRNLMVNSFVFSIARQSDGRIIFGGVFSSVDGQPRSFLARITLAEPLASVSVSGLVTTPDGRGLRNATVVITNSTGIRRTVLTSSFGAYTFNDVASNETYTLSVNSRRYRFAARQVTVNGNLSDVNFVGLE